MAEQFQGTPIPPRSPLPFTGVSRRKRSVFYTQLGRMLRAGLSPVKSLATLAGQRMSGRLSRAAGQMAATIEAGGTLGSAFAAHSNLFPPSEVRMIEASELGGTAPAAMARIASFLDQLAAAQRRVITGMIYPVLCLFIVFFVLPNAAWFFVPEYFPMVWPYQLMFVAAVVVAWFVGTVAWRSLNQVGTTRHVIHGLLHCVPVVGGVVRKLAWARFANTFECLYSAGVLVHEALAVAARACGDAVIGARLLRVVPQVAAGGSLTEALAASRALPPLALDMLAVGEQAGKLDEALRKFVEYQEEEISTSIQRLSKVLVLLVILGYMALMVFLIFMVFSTMLAPMYRAIQ